MKRLFAALIIALLMAGGCNKAKNPVSAVVETPPPVVIPEPIKIALAKYGTSIDSAYYKNWSDGSWEKFNGVKTINNKKYVVVLSKAGSEYYYTELGYAGWKDKTSTSAVIFNTPLGALPDTLIVGQTYWLETSFQYSGYSYGLFYRYVIKAPIDLQFTYLAFYGCLEMEVESTLSAGGQSQKSNGTSWSAIGPGTVKQKVDNSYFIAMTEGNVNGKDWKISAPGVVTKLNKSPFGDAVVRHNPLLRATF